MSFKFVDWFANRKIKLKLQLVIGLVTLVTNKADNRMNQS